jgi:predicted nucleic acid-binding protein
MIYLDTSVVLAHLLGEVRAPKAEFWDGVLVSSRLLEYELWNRLNARGIAASHGEAVRALLARMVIVELTPAVLARALAPFPLPVRILDGLHLASIVHLSAQRQTVSLATYDRRMGAVAEAMGIDVIVA